MILHRSIFLAIAGIMVLATAGPGQEKGFETPFYPLKVGSKWHYRAGEDQKVLVRVVKVELFEIMREKKKEKVQGATLEIVSGGRVLTEQVAVLADGVYRFASAGKEISPPLRFLKLPTQKGDTWQIESTSNDKILKGGFTSDEVAVTVPAGKFAAITASCKDFQIGDDKMTLDYWFAPKVGIVRQRVQVGNFDVVLELEKYEEAK